jgi:hypothetical protein
MASGNRHDPSFAKRHQYNIFHPDNEKHSPKLPAQKKGETAEG